MIWEWVHVTKFHTRAHDGCCSRSRTPLGKQVRHFRFIFRAKREVKISRKCRSHLGPVPRWAEGCLKRRHLVYIYLSWPTGQDKNDKIKEYRDRKRRRQNVFSATFGNIGKICFFKYFIFLYFKFLSAIGCLRIVSRRIFTKCSKNIEFLIYSIYIFYIFLLRNGRWAKWPLRSGQWTKCPGSVS